MAEPVKIFVNVPDGFVSASDGVKVGTAELPIIFKSQQKIFAINLIDESGEAIKLNIDDTFQWCADDDHDSTSTPWMETLNGDFNVIGQRSDLDVVNGKISFKADADTTEFDTEIGVKESEQLFSQIEVYENGETKPYLVPKFIVIANNLVCGPTSPTPPLTDYFTKAETLSLLEDKEDLRIRKLVPVFDATATPSVVLHTVTASTVGVPIALYLRIETLTGSITNNFVYDLGITGDLTKYINGGVAPVGFDSVDEILPIDLSGFDSVPALSDLILTITTGSDATTMTVKALTDITEY